MTNLNADMVDGIHAGSFVLAPVTSVDILDGAIVDADIDAAAAIQGTKIDADFGTQDLSLEGQVNINTPGGYFLESDLVIKSGPEALDEYALIEMRAGYASDEVVGFLYTKQDLGLALGTYTDSSLCFYVGNEAAQAISETGDARFLHNVDVEGAISTLGNNIPYQVKGLGATPGTHGYLGAQGESDFDGQTTLDIPSQEIGVLGTSLGGTDTDNYGVYGHSNGVAVRGEHSSAPTTSWGQLGTTNYGVDGSGIVSGGRFVNDGGNTVAYTALDIDGVHGGTSVSNGWGVHGSSGATTGANTVGVRGGTASSSGYGVYSSGAFGGTGAKYFINPHPTDPTKEVRMVCLEGNESGTYFRGTSRTQGGVAVIDVPEVFRLASSADRMTVQVTPVGELAILCVESQDLDQVVVRSSVDVEFHYFVNGVRRGYEDLNDETLVVDNTSYLPEDPDAPFGTQYPDSYRQILVQNGILNPDFTPNPETMASMEAALEGYRLRRAEYESMRAALEAESERRALPALQEAHESVEVGPRERIPQESGIRLAR